MDWLGAGDYEFARQLLQRGVAATYLVAFLSTLNQFPALLGDRGLLPTRDFVARVGFRHAPSVFHWRYSDRMLRALAAGAILVCILLVAGIPQLGPPWIPLVLFLLLWMAYLSIVNVGQTFYGFGWESLLLEAGFVVAFLGSDSVAPPATIMLFLRWLVFRLEFGAGMIKIRGGREWRDLTALMFHHETQPMPSPGSWYAHRLPAWFHRAEVVANHFAQLVVPFFLFAPQPVASVAAGIVILTQLWLVATGNFAWLNWITIVLAFCAIDDRAVHLVIPAYMPAEGHPHDLPWEVVVIMVSVLLLVLSYWPARNLLSRHQLMNASFNRYHLVNAYGAFGTVTRKRFEIVIEGSAATSPADSDWLEYEFRGKPGDLNRMPRQFAPYHLRLDWLMWFLALGSRNDRWFRVLLIRLLEGDRATLRLLRRNPFADAPPTRRSAPASTSIASRRARSGERRGRGGCARTRGCSSPPSRCTLPPDRPLPPLCIMGHNRPMPSLLRGTRAVVAAFSRSRFFRRFGPRMMPPLERGFARLSGGRIPLSGLLVPSLVLHTIGAKSGMERESPLMYCPEPGGRMLVTGSNFAREGHPAWTANLTAHPDAAVTVGGRRIAVRATRIPDDELEEVWAYIERQWPGYRGYERASGRTLRIFRLVPTA